MSAVTEGTIFGLLADAKPLLASFSGLVLDRGKGGAFV
jgi:hypothetical protein